MIRAPVVLFLSVALALPLAGCLGPGSCSASQNPTGQVAVCNHKDSFAYAYQAGGYTKTESFPWENGHTRAEVEYAGQLGSGTIAVKIKDTLGVQVYSRSYSGVGQSSSEERTGTGPAGTWTIDLDFSAVTGQVALTIRGV